MSDRSRSGRRGATSGRTGGAEVHRVHERGHLTVPRDVLEAVGLEPKMRVRFRVEDSTIVIDKEPGGANPLDAPLGRKLDGDLFGKILNEQEERKRRQLGSFGDKVKDAAEDDTPPDHPFGRD